MDGHPARFSVKALRSVRDFSGAMILITALTMAMSQADKMILSRVVSLEAFGFYMLASTVVAGLSRVATPLIQTFGPRFTELLSRGDGEGLAKQVRLASQLMSVLILPPAALIMFLSKPILFAWLGNQAVADGASQILAAMVVGAVFTSCSYPALSILYSRQQFRPVVVVNLVCLLVLLPLLIQAVFIVFAVFVSWREFGEELRPLLRPMHLGQAVCSGGL
jgi:O-antigen/teichoic acid export membrane protein